MIYRAKATVQYQRKPNSKLYALTAAVATAALSVSQFAYAQSEVNPAALTHYEKHLIKYHNFVPGTAKITTPTPMLHERGWGQDISPMELDQLNEAIRHTGRHLTQGRRPIFRVAASVWGHFCYGIGVVWPYIRGTGEVIGSLTLAEAIKTCFSKAFETGSWAFQKNYIQRSAEAMDVSNDQRLFALASTTLPKVWVGGTFHVGLYALAKVVCSKRYPAEQDAEARTNCDRTASLWLAIIDGLGGMLAGSFAEQRVLDNQKQLNAALRGLPVQVGNGWEWSGTSSTIPTEFECMATPVAQTCPSEEIYFSRLVVALINAETVYTKTGAVMKLAKFHHGQDVWASFTDSLGGGKIVVWYGRQDQKDDSSRHLYVQRGFTGGPVHALVHHAQWQYVLRGVRNDTQGGYTVYAKNATKDIDPYFTKDKPQVIPGVKAVAIEVFDHRLYMLSASGALFSCQIPCLKAEDRNLTLHTAVAANKTTSGWGQNKGIILGVPKAMIAAKGAQVYDHNRDQHSHFALWIMDHRNNYFRYQPEKGPGVHTPPGTAWNTTLGGTVQSSMPADRVPQLAQYYLPMMLREK
jgi:hypothetical protein